MYTLVAKDWKELSRAASQEHDPKRLMELIEQLDEALEQKYGGREQSSDHQESKTQLDAA